MDLRMTLKEKLEVLEILKEDFGDSQYRKAVARVVSKTIIDQWDREKYLYSKSLGITQLTERINVSLLNLGLEPVSYPYVRSIAEEKAYME